jgi:hypothetical protein
MLCLLHVHKDEVAPVLNKQQRRKKRIGGVQE